MPVHTYTNWNSRPSDQEEQIEPFRKYFFICEGANTETFYFKRLIDLRKQLSIHPVNKIIALAEMEALLLCSKQNLRNSKMFTIKYERNHYAVYRDGIFYCSADTLHEAEHEIEEAI